MQSIDAGAQENARRLDWRGPGKAFIKGEPVDLTRQATGDMALLLRYRVEQAPTSPVRLGVPCGSTCGAWLSIGGVFAGAPVGQWRTLEVKLSCFQAAGADLSRVDTPFELASDGRFSLSFSEIRLVANEGGAICP